MKAIAAIIWAVFLMYASAGFTFSDYEMQQPRFFAIFAALIVLSAFSYRNLDKLNTQRKRLSFVVMIPSILLLLVCLDAYRYDPHILTYLFALVSASSFLAAFTKITDWIYEAHV